MMSLDYDKKRWAKACPGIDPEKAKAAGLSLTIIPSSLGDDSKESPVAPKNGEFCNMIVRYEANGHTYIYTAQGVPVSFDTSVDFDDLRNRPKYAGEPMTSRTNIPDVEASVSAAADTLQAEIDEIKNSPDVVDIVATYADLEAYDTSKLGDNDVIRVLADETHEDASVYYRWNTASQEWTYIGSTGPYYTKAETELLLNEKQNTLEAGENISIIGNVISAEGSAQVLYDGFGTRTDGAMTQLATTSLVYSDPGSGSRVRIGNNNSPGAQSVAIGRSSNVPSSTAVAVGADTYVGESRGVAVGYGARAAVDGVALGSYAMAAAHTVNIGARITGYGYDGSVYRLLSGVYDGQGAHDAVTVGQVNSVIDNINSALGTSITHIGA